MPSDLVKAVATELVNCRINRNGAPSLSNALDLLTDKIREEVMEDAERIVAVVTKHHAEVAQNG